MTARRLVRVAPAFFEDLDALLPAERSPAGTPSATDFLLHDLPRVIDRLAADYEGSTIGTEDEPDVRMLVTTGALVPYLVVYASLSPDGVVVLLSLDIDPA